MFHKIGDFLSYLVDKKSEIADLETKDALLAKTILDIHRKRTHSDFVIVPLFSLTQIHAIDHENAIKSTQDRVNLLKENKNILLGKKVLTRDVLSDVLPSISAIKVVRQPDDSYIAYEGNGRLVALQEVFFPSDRISVEVEEYYFNNPVKILRRMTRIRELNGLTD
jgi:hypothetical protein|tara:strand:- start:5177 stop:5674 length:498 start_codon:yes stop_codon:yes gene_type:complete